MKVLAVAGLLLGSICLAQNRIPEERMSSLIRTERLAHTPTDDRIASAERTLANAPGNLRVRTDLVSAYLQKVRESGDYSYLDRASKVVDSILQQDSSSTVAAHFQNEIGLQRHQFGDVADRAAGMTKYNPSDAAAWANLGDASMELGRYEQAGEAYLRLFALRADLTSYNRLAYFRFVNGDSAAAIDLMQKAVDAGSPMAENTAWCGAELGDLFFKTGQLAEARKTYSESLRLFPRLHRAIAGLARVDLAEGHISEAVAGFRRAQEIVPLVEYAAALEDAYTLAANNQKAAEQRALIETIDRLARATGEKANRNLALIYADRGWHLDRAAELIQEELPGRGDVYTWDAASWVYFKGGRLAEARDASRKALRVNTPEPAFYYHASEIAKAAGDERAAANFALRLTAINPHFVARPH